MRVSDDLLNIDTPENVAFGFDVAGIGSRFIATLVDTLLILVLQVVVNLVLAFFTRFLLGDIGFENDASAWLMALFGLVSFFCLWGYFIVFEMIWNGQSPGKRWTGLRVIRTDGTPITLVESIVRNLVRLVDFLPVAYGVGLIVMFINAQSRRLGDLAAGTLVIYDTGEINLADLTRSERILISPNLTVSDEVAALPIERLTAQDWLLLEDFLRRRHELSSGDTLATKLVKHLYKQMEMPQPSLFGASAQKRLAEIYQHRRKQGD